MAAEAAVWSLDLDDVPLVIDAGYLVPAFASAMMSFVIVIFVCLLLFVWVSYLPYKYYYIRIVYESQREFEKKYKFSQKK